MAYSVWSRIYFGTWSTGYGEGYTLINGAQGSDEDIMLYMEYRVRIRIYLGT